MLRYQRQLEWKGHALDPDKKHDSHILSLAIDPEGNWVLSGGLDGFARIWSLSTGSLLGEVDFDMPVTSLEWPMHRREFFYAGCSSGMASSCSVIGASTLNISYRRHSVHERGSVQLIKVAAVIGADIIITATTAAASLWTVRHFEPGEWHKLLRIPDISTPSLTDHAEAVISSVHWLGVPSISGDSVEGQVLYLKGLCSCWDLSTLARVWTIPIAGCGRSDLSADQHFLAIHNIRRGISIYNMSLRTLCEEMPLDQSTNAVLLSIKYVHGGCALATGSSTGKVRIWNANGGLSQIQKLVHDQVRVPVIASHCSEDGEDIILVSASFQGHIYIWKAGQVSTSTETASQGSRTSGVWVWKCGSLCALLLALTGACCALFVYFHKMYE
ncbi:WD40 repeat-like protein [Peniophora sp. CONT]|nr:WD40 repeat-like protein [Peniophora sp. CONT]